MAEGLMKPGFLRNLSKMRLFWLLMLELVFGLILTEWVLTRLLHASFQGMLFGMIYAAIVGITVILLGCHRFYNVATAGPSRQKHPLVLIIETTPLLFGAVVFFYLLLSDQTDYLLPAIVATFAVWFLLRLALKRETEKEGET
jgi:hypothetical protein